MVASSGKKGRRSDGARFEALLRERLRHAQPGGAGPALARARASVTFDAGKDGAWSVGIHDGDLTLTASPVARPTTRVLASAAVLGDIITGRRAGVDAFLDGDLDVTGNLALSLQLDGMFDTPERPAHFPRAGIALAAGVRTAYLEAGPPDAPPVVCLHGLGATNASMLPTMRALSSQYHVILPDLPGHGATEALRAPYDAPYFARWLSGLMDVLRIRSAVLIGNSLGGRISLEVALEVPRRVDALALYAPAVAFRRVRQYVPLVHAVLPEITAFPLPLGVRTAQRGLRMMFADPDRLPERWQRCASEEFVRVFRRPRSRMAFFAALRSIYLDPGFGEGGFWTRLPQLSAPALFLWGDQDRLVPAGFSRHVSEALPSARSMVLEDCGHVPQFEQPELTHQLVREFLSDVLVTEAA